jgi:hypothetical protein
METVDKAMAMHEGGRSMPAPRRRDVRAMLIAVVVVGIAVGGYLVSLVPGRGVDADKRTVSAPPMPEIGFNRVTADASPEREQYQALIDPRSDPKGHEGQVREIEIRQRLKEADEAIRAEQYERAFHAAQRALELNPANAGANTRAGQALNGGGYFEQAMGYFQRAIELDPMQADAYFGVAEAQEAFGNLEGAIGGMRTFLHLTDDPDPNRLRIAQARSAIWEWESRLGRGPWGPTKGIPPGFSDEELRRDGKGVAIKMQVGPLIEGAHPGYEIKAGEKRQIFSR